MSRKGPPVVVTEIQAWAIILPPTKHRSKGRIIIDPDFIDERHAWYIALGWPSDLEVEQAKQAGARAVRATITYEETVK